MKSSETVVHVTRRQFMEICPTAIAGLVLAMYLDMPSTAPRPAVFRPNAFLNIDGNGNVMVVVPRAEMGQGVTTSLPAIVADELEAEWSKVSVTLAPFDPKYGDQNTGGSESIHYEWQNLRRAGATAREMLIQAFAEAHQLPRSECVARNGFVVHLPTERQAGYGQLVAAASRLKVPKHVRLKNPGSFKLIGKSLPRTDAAPKLTGRAQYGLDQRVPGMMVAALARCPVCTGKARSFDATAAMKVEGVRKVVPTSRGVAVVAHSTWAALQGREALSVTWDEGEHAAHDSVSLRHHMQKLTESPAKPFRDDGNVEKALAQAAQTVSATYELPFLAHAPMEPPNCVAHVTSDRCELWVPTQSPGLVHQTAKRITGLPDSAIRVNVTYLGGGFGRRFFMGEVEEAVEISRALGVPIQVVWTRDDDVQHDYYRPASFHQLTAGIDSDGWPIAWLHRFSSTPIASSVWPDTKNPEMLELAGAVNMPYAIPNVRVEYAPADCHVARGWLRSVQHTFNAFVVQSFVDELAQASGKDPVEYRMHLLRAQRQIRSGDAVLDTDRLRRVLEVAAERAGWGKALSPGQGQGIAHHYSFNTYVAAVVHVSTAQAGRIKVDRVVCVVDCGRAINPDGVKAQIESAVLFGLSAALKGEITLEHGRVRQSNFHDYEILRISDAPQIEVHIVPSELDPTGVGEPGVPPIAPAFTNAVFAATQRRIRRLPASG